ncbi:MAG: site-2 protease family protein [Geitlerinemataceae cyanobacterium]
MNGSFRVGSLFGIPFYVNTSWFIVLALVTLNYGGQLGATFPELGGTAATLLGLVSALLLFSSVLAHELGHSFVAMSQGIEVKSISLFLFGGLASFDRESKTPSQAFWVAIAGPLVSLGIFLGLRLILNSASTLSPVTAILSLLASINLVLALFNLIPGLPLDGGNVLKAIVWKITGDPYKGVVFAGRVGQVMGWLAIGLGLIPILLGGVPQLWTILIGWFLLQNAGRAAQSAKIERTLSNRTAADVVSPNSPIVRQDLTLREFANQHVIGNSREWKRFLVVDGDKKLVGAIAVDDTRAVATSDWVKTTVAELTKPLSLETIAANTSLLEALQTMERLAQSELPVADENGAIVGLFEKNTALEILREEREPDRKREPEPEPTLTKAE